LLLVHSRIGTKFTANGFSQAQPLTNRPMGIPPGGRPAAGVRTSDRPAVPYMERCRRRFGDFFSIGWQVWDVSCSSPIPQRSRSRHRRPRGGAREGTSATGPCRHRSADDSSTAPTTCPPPPHAAALPRRTAGGYGDLRRSIATRDRDLPAGTPFATQDRMRAITLEIILRGVRHPTRTGARGCRACA